MQAEAACEQLRSHGIKCGSVETSWSGRDARLENLVQGQFAPPRTHSGRWDVVVAPKDAERANDVLRAWDGSEGI
ncbi:MAG TPA: hypothetical protein VKR23_15165 [Gaiellaceae bacterium]|nr:hypothetical protein [Gaiellaceae bacterium]